MIMKQDSQRILNLDLLRALATFYVVYFFHLNDYVGNIFFSQITLTLAFGTMSIFVFISSFILTKKYHNISTAKDIKNFIKKRVLRIYPLYLSALILFLMTSLISYKQFLAGIFLLNSILNIRLKTLWFISIIFIYYLLLSFILYNFSKQKTIFVSFAFLLICIGLHNSFGLIDIRLIYYFPSFITGIICAKYNKVFNYIKSKTVFICSLLSLTIITYLSYFFKLNWFNHVYMFISTFLPISPLILFSELLSLRIHPNIYTKFSYATFCMYIYHRIIYWILLKIRYPGKKMLILAYLACVGIPIIYFISKNIQTGYDFFLKRLNSMAS
jgi:peptidoglycan/LPS O-acetylase OafA/YrhL